MSQIKRYCGNCRSVTYHEKYKYDEATGRQSGAARVALGLVTSGISEFVSQAILECCDCGKKNKV